jgi:hypothetical protein
MTTSAYVYYTDDHYASFCAVVDNSLQSQLNRG